MQIGNNTKRPYPHTRILRLVKAASQLPITMKKYISLIFAATVAFTTAEGKIEHLLPAPKIVTKGEGGFALGRKMRITAEGDTP